MTPRLTTPARPWATIAIIAVQALCAAIFVVDAVADWVEMGRGSIDAHLWLEMTATASLILAIVLEAGQLRRMLLREAHMARSLSAAGRALHDILEAHFAAWRLTPSEQDVATFLVKGADIAEIARLRGSAEGTVKAHLNAIYRKAGVTGRPGLLALLIEDLMGEPLIGGTLGPRLGGEAPPDPATGLATPGGGR